MSLRMIYGRAGSGKTRFCLEEIKKAIASGKERPLALLVPEQYTFQAERDLIDVLETGGILKTEVLSFRRLAYRVFNEAGGITYPHIHSAGKCMILHRILDRKRNTLSVFADSARHPGFVNKLSSMITEFKRYSITPVMLSEAARDVRFSVQAKINELSQIFDEFEKTLKARYRDSEDDLTLAAEKLASSSLLTDGEIWIDGFSGFTPQEYRIILKLMKKANRVNITLCTDSLGGQADPGRTDVFTQVKAACSRIWDMAREEGVKIEPAVSACKGTPYRFFSSTELAHLENSLNAYPYTVYKGKTKDICLFSATGMFTEVEAAAAEIIRLCRDEDMRYRDIAVVTGNLSEYERLIEVVFEEYDIPCFIDRKVDITNHPLVRLVLSVLEIFIENWSYEAVFRYLKTGLTGTGFEETDLLENYVLACGIRGSKWTDEKDWHMTYGMIPDENIPPHNNKLLSKINCIKKEVCAPLLKLSEKIKGRNTAAQYCESLYEFLCTLEVPERIEEAVEGFRQQGYLDRANEYSQVWNTVMEVFDQAVEVMDDEKLGTERFADILRIGFAEYRTGLIPAALDQVLAGNLERSRSHDIKALFVLGANDGVFPFPAAEEGMLSDRDREELGKKGIELASDTRTQAFDGQYMVYRALTTPEKHLRISWPISDSEGRSMRPSHVVYRIRRLFPEIAQSSNISLKKPVSDDMPFVCRSKPAFRHMVTQLRRKADGEAIDPVWQEVFRWFCHNSKWKVECLKLKHAFCYTNTSQPIQRNRAAELYGTPFMSSVSRLERYASCPFAFFIRYGLGAQERKVYGFSPPDVGTFLHAAIERFSSEVSKTQGGWRDFGIEWCRDSVSAIVDAMLDNMKGRGIAASKRYTALARRLKRVVTRAVWIVAQHIRKSSFDPTGYEVVFGGEGDYPPITIELPSGEKVSLTGRIDRVDRLKTDEGTYLRIVDYKSGSRDFQLSDAYYGLQIQLVTYMDAIQTAEAGGKVMPGGLLYFKIDDPLINGSRRMGKEEIEKAILKQLKMRGLLLADVKLIKQMDNTIEGSSTIIPAAVNKGDVLGSNTSAATREQFEMLRRHVVKLVGQLCAEIRDGNTKISPYRKKDISSCKYCSFKPVCQFDTAIKDNKYRTLYDIDRDDIWSRIKEEAGQNG